VGYKRGTDTGPVHSPISRHYAGGKDKQKKQEQQTNKTKTTPKQPNQKPNKTTGQSDRLVS
jgi:hypothetical protein